MKCDNNLIKADIQNETVEETLSHLQTQLSLLEHQNTEIRLKLDEENKRGIKMARLLRSRRPFNRTKTGEVIFPGKKEMESKLNIMEKEILKLRTVLDGFWKDSCRKDLVDEIFKSVNCNEFNAHNEDPTLKLLANQLDEKYEKQKNDFDNMVVEVSKLRVKLDAVKQELNVNEKILEEIESEFNEANRQLKKLQCSEKVVADLKKKLDNAEEKLDGLKSLAEYHEDELNSKYTSYMKAIHEKEYQTVRADELCKEKARLTAGFEAEYARVKEYFTKRIQHVSHLPATLQALQEQLTNQKELRTSIEKTIEALSKRLKIMIGDPCGDSRKSKQLKKLQDQNVELKKEHQRMERVLSDLQRQHDETKRKKEQQLSQLETIKADTNAEIIEIRSVLKGPADEYLRTLNQLQNRISKIQAYSCFEDGKLKHVSSIMDNQIEDLTEVLKDAQEQISDIVDLQNYLRATRVQTCTVSNPNRINVLEH